MRAHPLDRLAVPQRGAGGGGLQPVVERHAVAADELPALGGEDAERRRRATPRPSPGPPPSGRAPSETEAAGEAGSRAEREQRVLATLRHPIFLSASIFFLSALQTACAIDQLC